MNLPEHISSVVAASNKAPSGDNCQPWRFEVTENSINYFLLPERDTSLYSWGQRASLVAIGAAIENGLIQARALGYEPTIELFPDTENTYHVATIRLNKGAVFAEKLADAIGNRHTNRKPYINEPLTASHLAELTAAITDIDGVKVSYVTAPAQKKILGSAAGVNERIIFENKPMHDFFYNHVTWSVKEAEEKRIGFFIKTLEIPGPGLPGFKLAQNWHVVKLLNKIGFSKFIAKQNGSIYAAAGAFGALTVESTSEAQFVNVGRALERIWLTATSLGLNLQPLTGVVLLMLRLREGRTSELSQEHVDLIRTTYSQIESVFETDAKEKIVIMFRVGKALAAASARSNRLEPDIR